jgi:hypothetical protein
MVLNKKQMPIIEKNLKEHSEIYKGDERLYLRYRFGSKNVYDEKFYDNLKELGAVKQEVINLTLEEIDGVIRSMDLFGDNNV